MRHTLNVNAEVSTTSAGDATQQQNINLRMLKIKGYSFKKVRRSQLIGGVKLKEVKGKIIGYNKGEKIDFAFDKKGIHNIY